jgi:hypothetical protein
MLPLRFSFRSILFLLGFVTVIVLSVEARLRFATATKSDTPLRVNSPPVAGTNSEVVQNPPPVEVLPIMLRRSGFEPREINRPAGYYFLSVNNFSGEPEIVLRFDREQGNRLHEVTIPRGRSRWRQNVHLTPGTYLLSEATHPRWVCRITITA